MTKKPTKKTAVKTAAPRKRQAVNAPRGDVFFLDPEECVIAGVDTDDGPEHPCYQEHARRHREFSQAFIDTFKEYGNIQTIAVWKSPDGRLFVNEGRRRVLAARLANKQLAAEGCELVRLKAVVTRDEPHRLKGRSIVENKHREQTNMLEDARDCQAYLDLGRSREEAAEHFDCTTQSIGNMLRLLELAPGVLQAIEQGKISPTAALRRCHGKTVAEQMEAIDSSSLPKTGRPSGPTKATVKKLVESKRNVLHPMFLLAYRYFIGELTAKDVGLEDDDAAS